MKLVMWLKRKKMNKKRIYLRTGKNLQLKEAKRRKKKEKKR
jgi:hypothetical protein